MAKVLHKVFVQNYLENSTLLRQPQAQEPIRTQSFVSIITQRRKTSSSMRKTKLCILSAQ